jgi:hypothetical protein
MAVTENVSEEWASFTTLWLIYTTKSRLIINGFDGA